MKNIDEDCAVLLLAQRHNGLVQHVSEGDDGEDLDQLVEAASHLRPFSLDGVAFQIMCASAEVGIVRDVDVSPERYFAALHRVQRLLYGALSGLPTISVDSLQHSREHLMPEWLGPMPPVMS